jgi:hypothetical protein
LVRWPAAGHGDTRTAHAHPRTREPAACVSLAGCCRRCVNGGVPRLGGDARGREFAQRFPAG